MHEGTARTSFVPSLHVCVASVATAAKGGNEMGKKGGIETSKDLGVGGGQGRGGSQGRGHKGCREVRNKAPKQDGR